MLKKISFFCCFILSVFAINASELDVKQKIKQLMISYNKSIQNGNYLKYMSLQKGNSQSFRQHNMIFFGTYQLLKIKEMLNDNEKWQT